MIDPIEGVPGEHAHHEDDRQVDRHHPAPHDLQEHDEGAEVRGGPGQQEDEGGAGADALEHERGCEGRRGGGTRVDRDPEREHQQHRGQVVERRQLGRLTDKPALGDLGKATGPKVPSSLEGRGLRRLSVKPGAVLLPAPLSAPEPDPENVRRERLAAFGPGRAVDASW